ncbi:Iron-sulfur cluster assembly 1 homolog, mitochondrial [Geodia barretti]|uniref:Iron-sulfur cluster assembly 1 homolog, mitochondrial n=1 Tax=Geodia barretti TaxID=519541 RepID=A0AA35WTI2_GEOBA|nr:Iron-sulfur cluster assembly 1 homolog, mitochondrial [Geodia barretti]
MAQSAIRATVRTVNKGRRLVPKRAALELTPSALTKVRSLLSENSEAVSAFVQNPELKFEHGSQVGLRVGVRTRGCNGLSYTMDYATERGKLDEEVVQDGVRIFLDKKAQLTLLGTEMDYVETKLAREFVFNNPNAKGMCGCGESFHV